MDILVESAIRVTVLAAGVALVLRVLRIRSPRLTHGVWTAVVVIMLLLPMFVAMGPEFAVPLLPAHGASGMLVSAAGSVTPAEPSTIQTPAASSAATAMQGRITWTAAAGAAYLAGVGLFLLRLASGLRRVRAIRRGAIQVQGRLTHPACVTPLTVGVIAPAVILPADWASWDEAALSSVLAHEEEHVRRRDPLVAAVALLNRAVFWFHPLAWWLPREIARLSEQACDAAVIARGHDREAYLSCLLLFARRVTDAGGRIAPMSLPMPGEGLRERLVMLAHPEAAPPSRTRRACAIVACTALVVVCGAAAPTAALPQDVPSPTPDQARWVVHTTDHFEIFHVGLPVDRVIEAAGEAEAAYVHLNAALQYDMRRRVPIILVRRDRDVQDGAAQGRDPVLQSGVPAGQRVVISLESLDRRTGVVVHELSHQFAFEIIPQTSRVAPVLIEGLAEYHRGAWTPEDLRTIRAAAANGASVAGLATSDRNWAHALFDFVAAQPGEEGVRRLLFALRAHGTLAQAVPMAFGVTLDQFNESVRVFVTTTLGQR